MTPLSKRPVVVLGGGVSGLAMTYFMASRHPEQRVVLVEGSGRMGGWIASQRQDKQHLMELGPRSLRTAGHGHHTLRLVDELGIGGELVVADASNAGVKSRFIYKGGRLHELPSGLLSLAKSLTAPMSLTRGLVGEILREPFKPAKGGDDDESIHAFVKRRLGTNFADNFIDPLVHGIFAGDARQLSVRACFPFLWEAERARGSIILGALFPASSAAQKPLYETDFDTTGPTNPTVQHALRSGRMVSFRNGLETLVHALESKLKTLTNVKIERSNKCIAIQPTSQDAITNVMLENNTTIQAGHVFSCLPSHSLAPLVHSSTKHELADALQAIPFTNVAVVNVTYTTLDIKKALPIWGFGYLVPTSEKSDALGVILDSCAFPEQEASAGTVRLTLMMGGHAFQDRFGDPATVSPDMLKSRALGVLADHLKIITPPSSINAHIHRNCIAQYTVGHLNRLKKIHSALASPTWSGRLSVLGSSYKAVGINDNIALAHEVAHAYTTKHDHSITGLEWLRS